MSLRSVDEHVVPVLEGRLEIDERDVEGPLLTWTGVLNEVMTSQYSGNRTTIGPADERDVADELGPRRQVERRARGEEARLVSRPHAPYACVRG